MTKTIDETDFASAAMMRLVAAGLSRQGISIPVPSSSSAHVSLGDKRDVLGAVLVQHGPLAILKSPTPRRSWRPNRSCRH